ncbi:MAG: hypothetical protein ACRECU_11365 [Methylocella sp.]
MGAVEHLKPLCCLGLKPESAIIAATPLLHEIVPHEGSRVVLLKSDATFGLVGGQRTPRARRRRGRRRTYG